MARHLKEFRRQNARFESLLGDEESALVELRQAEQVLCQLDRRFGGSFDTMLTELTNLQAEHETEVRACLKTFLRSYCGDAGEGGRERGLLARRVGLGDELDDAFDMIEAIYRTVCPDVGARCDVVSRAVRKLLKGVQEHVSVARLADIMQHALVVNIEALEDHVGAFLLPLLDRDGDGVVDALPAPAPPAPTPAAPTEPATSTAEAAAPGEAPPGDDEGRLALIQRVDRSESLGESARLAALLCQSLREEASAGPADAPLEGRAYDGLVQTLAQFASERSHRRADRLHIRAFARSPEQLVDWVKAYVDPDASATITMAEARERVKKVVDDIEN